MVDLLCDSPVSGQVFATGETGRRLSDAAPIRALLLDKRALPKARGRSGVGAGISATDIHRAGLELQIDPGALALSTAENGVPLPVLNAAFQAGMQA